MVKADVSPSKMSLAPYLDMSGKKRRITTSDPKAKKALNETMKNILLLKKMVISKGKEM
jgi:hypothetical protein